LGGSYYSRVELLNRPWGVFVSGLLRQDKFLIVGMSLCTWSHPLSRLAAGWFWMLRTETAYPEIVRIEKW